MGHHGYLYTCVQNLNCRRMCIVHAPCPFRNLSAAACRKKCSRSNACGVFVHNRYGECFLKAHAPHEEFGRAQISRDAPEHETISCFREDATDEYRVTAV